MADLCRQIHQACRQANDLDMRQADAVSARIDLDLRAGAAFTRLMTVTLQNRIPDLADQTISYGEFSQPVSVHLSGAPSSIHVISGADRPQLAAVKA